MTRRSTTMIMDNSAIKGAKSELRYLDDVMDRSGFIRWQWEYKRATYDCKIREGSDTYYLRINTRAVEGKLEDPHAVLAIEDAYIGKAVFPHGVDYNAPIPDRVLQTAQGKLDQLKSVLV